MSSRRDFLQHSGVAGLGLLTAHACQVPDRTSPEIRGAPEKASVDSESVTLFVCGDVMTGRGIDQVLPRPSDARLHEPYMKSALGYVELAERASGPIPKPVGFSYVWGDALEEWEKVAPDLRIVNLETSVTTSGSWMPKGINYRMHPANIPCITAARINCCILANNHVLDWGYSGLAETLETLHKANVKTAGAGRTLAEAQAPATMQVPGKARVVVFAFGTTTSGIPRDWAATRQKPGVDLLPDLSASVVSDVAARVEAVKQPGDIVVASIHWGGNWGYRIPREHEVFAHRLIDQAAVDVVHGHSSHHPKGIEVYKEKPIIYGCGDFLNDYEGIGGYKEFRSQLALMYFLTIGASTRHLLRFEMRPLETKRFRLRRVSGEDARWLRDTLDREGRKLGTQVELKPDNTLTLRWQG
jgi:poly-gamma-glutamate capsule biosynthesis protein CapA/YwtB (metallophosphatase superfamily)